MSATIPNTPAGTAVPTTLKGGWFRRNRVLLLAIAVPMSSRAVFAVMNRYEIGVEYLFQVMMLSQFFVLIGFVTTVVWFLFFAGFSLRTRLAAVGLTAVAGVGFVAAVRKVEFDGQMTPALHFRWESDHEQLLAEHLAGAAPTAVAADLTVGSTDSPFFRGPTGDGTTPGVTLAPDWSAMPPKVLWRHPVGGGHAGIAVAGNSAVTLEQRGPDEAVVCYDRDTGRGRWSFLYPARFATSEPMGGDGPRTTPAIAHGDVFALGAAGDLACLAGATGKPKWNINVLTDNGATNIEWGMSGSPLVVGDLVVVVPGVNPLANAGRAVAAYDRATGRKVWANGSNQAAYASPQRATFGGKEQALVFDAAGLGGYDPTNGTELWRHPWKSDMGMNSAQPIVIGPDSVFVSSEKSNGGALVAIPLDSNSSAREVWRNRSLSARFASPVFHNGHIYGLSEGRLVCVDAAAGRRKWAEGNYGNGQILRAGDLLVITDERGGVHLVAADPEEYRELGSVPVFKDRTWNMPALAGNQFFVRNHREMACLELPTPKR